MLYLAADGCDFIIFFNFLIVFLAYDMNAHPSVIILTIDDKLLRKACIFFFFFIDLFHFSINIIFLSFYLYQIIIKGSGVGLSFNLQHNFEMDNLFNFKDFLRTFMV